MAGNVFHTFNINNTNNFTVPVRYQNLNAIGVGSQGEVCSALDSLSNGHVAIKKLVNPHRDDISAKRSFRELKLLKCVNHKNIVHLLDVFTPNENVSCFKEFYLVTKLMDTTLRKLSPSHLNHAAFSIIIYQILCGLKYMHSSGIIHRDLKPENIALNMDLSVKILDLGLARTHITPAFSLTPCVATPHYRAPEMLLPKNYNENVDIWSLGCIFGELLHGAALFPGETLVDMWTKITEAFGMPPESIFMHMDSALHEFLRGLPHSEGKSFEELFPDALFSKFNPEQDAAKNNDARDLLSKMLKIDPNERITVKAALQHCYIKNNYQKKDVKGHPSIAYDHSIEDEERSLEEWKLLIFEEVMKGVPPTG